MSSGDDLHLAGELSAENAQVRCNLFVGCNAQVSGDIIAGGTINISQVVPSLFVDQLRVNALLLAELNVPAITSTPQNNLVIAGLSTATIVRFQFPPPGGPTISITGINPPMAVGGFGRFVIFHNRASSVRACQFEHQNPGSIPVRRFINHGAAPRLIGIGEARAYYYDQGDNRWIEVS